MDIYCTIEERYIQAVEELEFGEAAKALKLFNELLSADANYSRTYYQLGLMNFHYLKDYQTSGYYFNKCIEIEPWFPDVYNDFVQLLVFLNMEKRARLIASKALLVAGVNKSLIYQQLGLLEEKNQNFNAAIECYSKSFTHAFEKEETENLKDAIDRVKLKLQMSSKYIYSS